MKVAVAGLPQTSYLATLRHRTKTFEELICSFHVPKFHSGLRGYDEATISPLGSTDNSSDECERHMDSTRRSSFNAMLEAIFSDEHSPTDNGISLEDSSPSLSGSINSLDDSMVRL
jgi:hypothetical protein